METPLSDLRFHAQPELCDTLLIAAWSGWADAASGASQAAKAIADELGAVRFASIKQQSFTVFTDHRPIVRNIGIGNGDKRIFWPRGDFYYSKKAAKNGRDLVLFYGAEPNLRWADYCDIFTKMATICDISTFVTLGSMNSTVPHTKPVVVDKYADNGNNDKMGMSNSAYQGPIFIGTAIAELLCNTRLNCFSYWAHNPHYLQGRHNPNLSLALCNELKELFLPPLKLNELSEDVEQFQEELKLVLEEEDLRDYIAQLEQQYDDNTQQQTDLTTGAALSEIEDILRRHGRGGAKK